MQTREADVRGQSRRAEAEAQRSAQPARSVRGRRRARLRLRGPPPGAAALLGRLLNRDVNRLAHHFAVGQVSAVGELQCQRVRSGL